MSLFTTSSSINADLARKIIAAGEAKLHEMGIASNIAIVDAQGFLIAYLRMDGARYPVLSTQSTKVTPVHYLAHHRPRSVKMPNLAARYTDSISH